jgi:hypothetical protein
MTLELVRLLSHNLASFGRVRSRFRVPINAQGLCHLLFSSKIKIERDFPQSQKILLTELIGICLQRLRRKLTTRLLYEYRAFENATHVDY